MSATRGKRAAVLGLGIIGSRAKARLDTAGWEVLCWNRTPKQLPGEQATPESAVESADHVSIYLKDVDAVRDVMARVAGVLKPGAVVMNHATVDLKTTLWLDQLCTAAGCRFLDTPFTGSKLASESGQLFFYTGGDRSLVDEVESYLLAMGRGTLHCGGVGSATVLKLATNLISACTVQAMAESLAIATHHGVAAEVLIRAVSENACASMLTAMKFPMMANGNYETHFSMSNMGKDSRYMLALAEEAGLETPSIAAVSRRMADLCEKGLAELDFSALAKPYLELE